MTSQLLAPGSPIPDNDHVLRYIGKKHVDNGVVNGSGFLSRPRDDFAPSVNWMECFEPPPENQAAEISARKRLNYEKRAVLVRLNVGQTCRYVTSNAKIKVSLTVVYAPLAAEDGKPDDPSHALMRGVPLLNTPDGEEVQDLFTHCIINTYPVAADK